MVRLLLSLPRGSVKLHWENLTKEERRRYMQIQMAPSRGGRSAYLPDDCGECPVCDSPALGFGLCRYCGEEYDNLRKKLEGRA